MNLPRPFNPQAGFSLIEIAIVLGILGLLLSLFAGMSTNLISQHRRELTRTRLANIDTALTLFVSQYKRLPCPADGTQDSANALAGLENAVTGPPRTCTSNQRNGVLPWRAVGLAASDIEDGWGGRFTYRVGPELVVDNAMDFSSCDPAGTNITIFTSPASYCNPICSAATFPAGVCTPPNTALAGAAGKGLVVENVAGTVIMDPRANPSTPSTGAAYVVISHGADGGGAYSGQGVAQGSSTAAGTMEAMNFPNLTYTLPPALPAAPTSFMVDDVYNVGVNNVGLPDPTLHFDDMVSRPNILTVATRAQLGPRSH